MIKNKVDDLILEMDVEFGVVDSDVTGYIFFAKMGSGGF